MKVAWVFQEVDGLYRVSNYHDILVTDGPGYKTKADALRAADRAGYTHAIGSGTYWPGIRRIPAEYRNQ
jgi:hypothetical protein